MNYELSVFMPTIRVHLLPRLFNTLENSATKARPFELVCCGPFEPPAELMEKENFKWIKSYASPTVAAQIAALNCSGEWLLQSVDDAVFYRYSLFQLMNITCNYSNTFFSAKYIECPVEYKRAVEDQTDINYEHKVKPEYWLAGTSYPGWPGVNPQWNTNVHFLMERELFLYAGGFDCSFEYLTHSTGDLVFRLQQNGYKYKDSVIDITACDWIEGTQKDHAPIHHAQLEHDVPLFREMWYNCNNRFRINLENYLEQPERWERRFGSI